MASPRRNLCDDILRLIDEALAEHERFTTITVVGRGRLPTLAPVTVSPRSSGGLS